MEPIYGVHPHPVALAHYLGLKLSEVVPTAGESCSEPIEFSCMHGTFRIASEEDADSYIADAIELEADDLCDRIEEALDTIGFSRYTDAMRAAYREVLRHDTFEVETLADAVLDGATWRWTWIADHEIDWSDKEFQSWLFQQWPWLSEHSAVLLTMSEFMAALKAEDVYFTDGDQTEFTIWKEK